MGFTKAMGWAEIKSLTKPITRSFGYIWLIAALLFLSTALLFLFDINGWWLAGLFSIIFSQILITYFWQDAKYGTIANALILIFTLGGALN